MKWQHGLNHHTTGRAYTHPVAYIVELHTMRQKYILWHRNEMYCLKVWKIRSEFFWCHIQSGVIFKVWNMRWDCQIRNYHQRQQVLPVAKGVEREWVCYVPPTCKFAWVWSVSIKRLNLEGISYCSIPILFNIMVHYIPWSMKVNLKIQCSLPNAPYRLCIRVIWMPVCMGVVQCVWRR